MSSFDKFMNDLEKRRERKRIAQAKLQQDEVVSTRDRVLRYAELWLGQTVAPKYAARSLRSPAGS